MGKSVPRKVVVQVGHNWTKIVIKGLLSVLKKALALFLLCIVCVAGLSFYAWGKYGETILDYKNEAQKIVDESDVNSFRNTESSYIYNADKKSIAKLTGDKDSFYLEGSKIPDSAKKCFIAVEDRRFYKHKGVDFLSVGKAAVLLVSHKGEITRGGSTITQQLVKNAFLMEDVMKENTKAEKFSRKFKEIFAALALENKYTKEQILEYYINDVYFGNGYYGLGAAAKGYFSKSVSECSLAEIAFMCAIPNSPTYYDPIRNYDNTKKRQLKILNDLRIVYPDMMDEVNDALKEKVKLKVSYQKFYNYEATYAIDCTVRYLMKKNGFNFKYSFKSMSAYKKYNKKYSKAYDEAKKILYTGGYKVYTSIDSSIQKVAQNSVNSVLSNSGLEGATTVIDNSTGKIVAIVGGRRTKSDSELFTINRAFQMHKQPGSTIKPLVVYTPILERGYTKTTTVDDSRFSGGPSNSNGVYNGSIPLYYAVEQSKNVVAWRLFQSIGPKTGLSYLQKMHFTQIVPNDYYPAASLGGLTYGCTTTEMSSGYYTIFNKGVFVEPTCLVSIVDSSGSEVYEEASEERVYKNNAAVTMREIMEGVFKNGTARGLGLASGMPCAGKTGTTSNQTNGWFCGFTPYYTCAVWVGTDGNKSISGLWGSTYPGSIWKDVQTKLCADKKIKSFDGTVIQEKTTEAAPVYVQNTQSKPSVSKTKKPASTSKSKSTNEDAEDSDFESAKDIDSSDVSVVDESSEDTGDVIVIE